MLHTLSALPAPVRIVLLFIAAVATVGNGVMAVAFGLLPTVLLPMFVTGISGSTALLGSIGLVAFHLAFAMWFWSITTTLLKTM